VGVDTDYGRDFQELDQIKPPLAALIFRHKRLWAIQFCGYANLRKPLVLAGFDQQEAESLVSLCENGIRHNFKSLNPIPD
jgi:hypothetical protein